MTKRMTALRESDQAYGRIEAFFHVGGYSLARAFADVEELLDHRNRWKEFGFATVNEFLSSFNFKDVEANLETRKRLAKRIKELQPAASVRQIGRTVGVSEQTVSRASKGAARRGKAESKQSSSAPKGARGFSGERAANLVMRRETASQDRRDKVSEDEARVLALKPVPGKYRALVLDPAWEYSWLSLAGRAKPGYAMQTIEQLMALDVKAWADQEVGTHLYLWTTNNFMAEACKLVAHWGFQHRVLLTWIKPPPFGLGSYFRNSTEHCLFATLGKTTTRPAAASLPTHFEAPRGEHSEKPEKFYEIVRAASYPPYGEGNQREPRADFANLYCPATDAPENYKVAAE